MHGKSNLFEQITTSILMGADGHRRARAGAELLSKRREEFIVVRQRLQVMRNSINLNNFCDEEREFIENIVSYFPSMDAMSRIYLDDPEKNDIVTPLSFVLAEFNFYTLVSNPDLGSLVAKIERIMDDQLRDCRSVEASFMDLKRKVCNAS